MINRSTRVMTIVKKKSRDNREEDYGSILDEASTILTHFSQFSSRGGEVDQLNSFCDIVARSMWEIHGEHARYIQAPDIYKHLLHCYSHK